MLTVGMYIADRYEIVGKVGAGGMSDVYKAKDHILGRFVAIKVLKQEFSEDRTFVAKFRTEAQSAAGLEHPNIVNIYDVGSEEGMYYIVMEYVEGITLKTYIEKKGQLSFKESVSIAIQVARGIESAHNKNIIHRDIKPQNIIISTEGKVKVTDFGIARAASANTISSDVMGSVHYASPEQARNGFVDNRSDIYSLGIVMYEMVTGRVPFDGDTTVAVAIQHLQEEMVAPSAYAQNLPISLEKIILKCAQKNPDRRYQTIAELVSDLRKSLSSPDEDFVLIAPAVDNGKTKVISGEELSKIRSSSVNPQKEEPTHAKVSVGVMEEEKDEDDDDGVLNPKMDKAVTIMGVVITVVIIIFIIALAVKITKILHPSDRNEDKNPQTQTESQTESESESQQSTQIAMIKIVGMTKEQAQAELGKIGLLLAVTGIEPSEEEDGTILSQSVSEGEMVTVGTSIQVTVAGTEELDMVLVPDVVGKDENDAAEMLENNGLDLTKTYEYSDDVPAGEVISQDPVADSNVERNSKVALVISQGVESVEVPDVTGKTEEKATTKLEKAGLVVAVETAYDDTVEQGKVISQSVAGGRTVAGGTTITITISLGKEIVFYSYRQSFEVPEGAVAASYTLYDADGNVISNQSIYISGTAPVEISKHNITTPTGALELTYTVETVDELGQVVQSTVTGCSGMVEFERQE